MTGFYTPAQVEGMKARDQSLTVLDNIASQAYGRTPTPLVTYNLPAIGTVTWFQWWGIAQTITLDSDSAHQLALAGSIMPAGEQQSAYYDKAQTFLSAWATTNKGVGPGNDSPLSVCETVPGFIFADILIGADWPGRQQFLNWLQQVVYPVAASIQGRPNNWGAWGTFCKLMVEYHCGMDTAADVATLKAQLLAMIAPNGELPQEMLRVGSQLWYSYYAMVPLTCATREVMNQGGPNYFTESDTSARIQAAITNIINMAANPTSATGKPAGTAAQPWPYDLIDAMAEQYNNDTWRGVALPKAPISYWQHHTGWNIPTLTAQAGL